MKKTFKNFMCLFLVVILTLGLVACSGVKNDEPTPVNSNESVKDDPELVAFIEEQGDDFVSAFEESFQQSSGGMKCNATIEVEGTGLVVECRIKGLNNVPKETKTMLQQTYDAEKETLKEGFVIIKSIVPSFTSVNFNVCEEDGDLLASVDLQF